MKTAIKTPTQEDYDSLMRILEDRGYVWSNGEKPTKNHMWHKYMENTCVNINGKNKLELSPKKFYKEEGYKIISVKEYLNGSKKDNLPKELDEIKEKVEELLFKMWDIENKIKKLTHRYKIISKELEK